LAITLNALIEALTGAISIAQAELGRNQIIDIGRYFEVKTNRPRLLKVTVPSMKPGDNRKEVTFGVPLLTLHSPSQLRIKEVEFQFDTDLGDFDEESERSVTVAEDFFGSKRALNINPTPGLLGRKNTTKVILKVEAADQSEGTSRLIGELNKMHGEILTGGSAQDDESTPPPPPTSPTHQTQKS
jgi:hypothetical protein